MSISTGQVVEAVKEQLSKVCGERIKTDAPGFKFSNPGYSLGILSITLSF